MIKSGILNHGLKFINLFIPKDVPAIMLIILIPIEIISGPPLGGRTRESYLSRILSLSVLYPGWG